MSNNSTALATVHPTQEVTIGPSSMGELAQLADSAAKTTFYGAKTKEQALLLMLTGKDLGLSYTQALRTFHVIEGRPAMSADGMAAICLGSKLCEYFRTIESTAESCTVETKRIGNPPSKLTFTMAEAKQAGLAGRAMWGKYPAAMLRARAKSMLARDVYPDLLAGIYDPDEIESTPRVATVLEVVPTHNPRTLRGRIADCTTLAELLEAGKMIRPISNDEHPDAIRYHNDLVAYYESRKAELSGPPIVEPTKDEQQELYDQLERGILKCKTVAELEKFGTDDVRPKAADLGKRLKGKLQTCYRDHHDKLSLEERERANEDPVVLEQEEPGAAG